MAVLDLLPTPKKKKKAPKGVNIPPVIVERYHPQIIPSQNPVPVRLARKLRSLGERYRVVHVTERLAQYLATGLCLLNLQMFLDWMLDLNVFVRGLLLAADIALLVYCARKQLVPVMKRPLGLEACALMVEKHFVRLRGHIIAAVQFSRPSLTRDSTELIQAVQQEADLRTASMDFGQIVPTKKMNRRILIALAVAGIWGGWFYLTAPGSVALLERAFLIPAKVPRKTEVVCLTGSKTIPAGDSILIEAQARGIIPSHGRVTMTDDTGHIQEITMDPEPAPHTDRFSLKVESVDHPFAYSIFLNDGTAGPYDIKTVPRPNVAKIECEQTYPDYTKLKPVQRSVGNLALLAGSKLTINGEANGEIVKATLKLVGLSKPPQDLKISGTGDYKFTGEIDIPTQGLTGFIIELTNPAGVSSGDQTQYRIDIVPDHPPSAEITQPQDLEKIETLKYKLPIAFQASDDYGLAKVTLCYREQHDIDASIADTTGTTAPPPPPATRVPIDIGPDLPLQLKGNYTLELSKLQPPVTEGTTIEFWIEAQDANTLTGPGITESEHHTVKIVSPADFKAETMNQLEDDFALAKEQEEHEREISENLRKQITNRGVQNPPPQPPPKP